MCNGILPVLALCVFSQMPVTAGQSQAYINGCRRVFDKQYQASRDKLDAMAAQPGPQDTYYTLQFALMGTLSMYEATGDVRYLECVLRWAETMISKAIVIDHSGKRNWPGPWQSPYADAPIYYDLWELQGSTELGRLARIILTNPQLQPIYGKRANAIYEFVEKDVVDKRLEDRDAFSGHLSQTKQRGHPMLDRTAMLLRLITDVYVVGRNEKHLRQARTLALAFKERFQPYRGAKIWDLDVGEPNHPPDTAHANRFPLAVIDLYRAGIVFDREDIRGLADLLTKVIWNQSLSDPRFTNFIDGSNGPYRHGGPWSNGEIYDGWAALGQYDPQVRKVCDATLRAILAGRHNPSLDYNGSLWGILALSGELAKSAAVAEREKGRR